MTESKQWTCPTCKENVITPFCGRCGEEPLPPRDLTVRGVAAKLVHALTSIDARAMRTLRRLLRFPGQLTLAWTEGVRKPYVAPFQIFLIVNIIFFAIQSFTGQIVFSSPLDSHLHHQDWHELAQSLLTAHLEAKQLQLAQYTPLFDRAVVLNAKSLIVLMVVPFALLLPVVFMRAHRPFMTHVAFSLHLYTFMLLVFCVSMVVAKCSALLGFGGLESSRIDYLLSVINLAACIAYLYVAINSVYGTTGLVRFGQAALLSVAVAVIVVGYRFALFLITLYAT